MCFADPLNFFSTFRRISFAIFLWIFQDFYPASSCWMEEMFTIDTLPMQRKTFSSIQTHFPTFFFIFSQEFSLKTDKNKKIALKFKHYTFFSSCPFHQLFNVFIFRHSQFRSKKAVHKTRERKDDKKQHWWVLTLCFLKQV